MDSHKMSNGNIFDFVLDLFDRRGGEAYMGESVSRSQHMEQTAACATAGKGYFANRFDPLCFTDNNPSMYRSEN